jgi:methionine-gamma-lyase
MEDSKNKNFKEKFYLDCGFATRALHAGEQFGQPESFSHSNPIYQTTTFVFKNAKEAADIFCGMQDGYAYTRLGNPTVKVLEAKVNALEGKEIKLKNPEIRVSTAAFATGMAAVSSALLAALKSGDTVILGDVVYGATEHFCDNVLPRMDIKTVLADMSNPEEFAETLKRNPKTKAVLFETPTNPTMKIADIEEISRIAKAFNKEIIVMMDNTFATPYLQNPLNLGADVVIHSTTKYICGHGVVVGGVVTTINDKFKDALYMNVKDIGGSQSPFDAWLVNMGIKTLPLRMEKHCKNAMEIAKFLEKHPKVKQCSYPGLESHPQHKLAKKQMKDFGGMISLELKGGYEAGEKLMDNIHLFTLGVSLGCVDSLIQHPASMTHACIPKDKRAKKGITDGLVRISVGIEDVEDLIKALDDGLKHT